VNSPVIQSPPKRPILVETRGYFKAGSIHVRSVAGIKPFLHRDRIDRHHDFQRRGCEAYLDHRQDLLVPLVRT
jgi:hypothetical protein